MNDAVKSYILISVVYAAWSHYQKQVEARERAAEQRAALHQMERKVLEGQLNPHFLFNCLNSVNALVKSDPERARGVLADLGETLRYCLDSDRADLVPLCEELAFTQTYLSIEQERFGNRIAESWRIDEGLEQFPVPPMVLQPLVENAIKHGLAPTVVGGRVTITAGRSDGGIALTVTDDGVGSRSEQPFLLEQGKGLHHTHRRLILQFPGSRGLTIDAGEGRFSVSAHIPGHVPETEPVSAELSHA